MLTTAPFCESAVPLAAPLGYGNPANSATFTAPGRYDVLPVSRGYEETALSSSRADYTQADSARTQLERQYALIEPSVTPASLGSMPLMTRGTGTMLQDPLRPEELKPQKRERINPAFIQAQGDTPASRYTPAHLELATRIEEASKRHSGHGAMDGFRMTPDEPDRGPTNALRNFGGGEIKDWRTGGFHPRLRITYVPETKKGQLTDRCMRFANPRVTGIQGSLYLPGTAPLGEMRMPTNADTRELADRRTAYPGGGDGHGGHEQRSLISLPFQNRDNGRCLTADGDTEYSRKAGRREQREAPVYNPDVFSTADAPCEASTTREYAGPMGRGVDSAMAPRADLSRQVRGHHAPNAELCGYAAGRVGDGVGGYASIDPRSTLEDHATQRESMVGSIMPAPAPGRSGASGGEGPTAYAFQREYSGPSGVREVIGRAPGGSSGHNMTTVERQGSFVSERQNHRSDAPFAQARNFGEEVATRTTAPQQPPNNFLSSHEPRRNTPLIERQIDPELLSPLRCNPYVQPLPRAY
jgi:hypothetical protein